MQAAMFVGGSLGPLLGGATSDAFGFRAAFAATGALFLFSGVLVTLFVPEPPRDPAEQAVRGESFRVSVRHILGRPELAMVIGMMTIIRIASLAPTPVLPLFIQQLTPDRTHLATTAGMAVAATGVASTLSALAVGYLSDRFGRRRTLLVSMAAAAVLCAVHALATSVGQLLVLRTAMGLAMGGTVPVVQALFTELTPPERRGMAFGLLATAGAAGNGVGPVAGSLIAAGFGVPAVFPGIAPAFLVGAWLVTRLPMTSAPAAAAPEHTLAGSGAGQPVADPAAEAPTPSPAGRGSG
jgi:MFS family permease